MYSAQITRKTPAAFILMLDRSGSTEEKILFGRQIMTKADAIAISANRLIREILNRSRREEGVMDYFHIAAIGYGGIGVQMLLGNDFVTTSSLQHRQTPTHILTRERMMPDGRMMLTEDPLRYWIEPQAEGSTPMRAALEKALTLTSRWCNRPGNANSYPPVIFNITDGEASDAHAETLVALARQIGELKTSDGNALIINVNISTHGGDSVVFPSSLDELPESRYARMLYEMSSEMPQEYAEEISRLKGGDSRSPFRAMGYNASVADIIAMLNIGSLSIKNTMNITNYTESVQNPEGHFRSLKNIFIITEALPVTENQMVAFDVMVDNVQHVMRCFLTADLERDERMRELSTYTQSVDCKYITPQIFLENEMLVLDDSGRAMWVDVLLQRVPDGVRLDRLKEFPQRLREGLDGLRKWLSENNFFHGNIKPSNVYILPDGTPVLTDYTRGSRQKNDADLRAIDSLIELLDTGTLKTAMAPQRYCDISEMCDGLMRARDGKEWVYLDKTGSQAFEGRFLSAGDFAEGRAVVEISSGFGLINVDGNIVIDPNFDDLEWDDVSNMAIVTRDGLSGLFDRAGQQVTDLIYDQILSGKEGLFPMKTGGKFGYLRKDGTIAIAAQFDDAYAFKDGFAMVRMGGDKYIIDTQGAVIQHVSELI